MSADQDWHRLHPLTPLLRGWRFLLLAVAAVGQQSLSRSDGIDPVYVALSVLAATAVAVLYAVLVWRTTRYRLTATELQVDSGLLQKRSRRVPLARLQSVDVVRPVVARVLGLAELRLEVVGGGSTEAPLAYLTEEQAQDLRSTLLAAGRTEKALAVDHDAVLVAVPTGTLVASVLLGAPLVAAVVMLLVVVVTIALHTGAAFGFVVAALPAYVGFLAVAGRRVLAEYGFTVAESSDGLRLRHGLLDTRSQTIPAGRVQGIRIIEPILWRPLGWVRVEVDVAGYGGRGEEQSATKALLPVAPRALAEALISRVLGAPLPVAAAPAPTRVRWRAPLSGPRLSTGLDDRHLVTRAGIWTTTTDVVPLAKVQSLRIVSGPWQQRLRLATLHADTAGRRLPGAKAEHRDVDEAAALLVEVSRRARAARRIA